MTKTDESLAFIFPGQGSQSVGMMRELAEQYAEVRETFGEASDALGYDLWQLASDGPAEKLNLTEHTQPAMLAADVAAFRIWKITSETLPAWMAGHSLGEYAALVCAESLDFQDAVRLVAERARLMQGAVDPGVGAMAAILGLEDATVIAICAETSKPGELVEPANFNSPGQIVIAGHASAVARATEALKGFGAKRAVLLPVSVPSHCGLMIPAALQFRAALANVAIHEPRIHVVHNVDAACHREPETIRSVLEKQLHSSVRWSDTIRFIFDKTVRRFVECGPGKVLAGLNKRIVGEVQVEGIFSPDSLNKALEFVK